MTNTFELRASDDGNLELDGHASTWRRYGGVYEPRHGRFSERIEKGSFRKTLAAGADVVLSIEHQPPYLARTPATLTLAEDDIGLHTLASLDPMDPAVQSLASQVRRRVLTEMSFKFGVPEGGDSWNSDRTERTIHEVNLDGGDVSIVLHGANRTTTVQMRSGRGVYEVRSAGGLYVARRSLRQDSPDDIDDGSDAFTESCGACDGTGLYKGGKCPECGGLGYVNPDDDDGDEGDGRAARAKYSAAELKTMMAKGHALANANGEASFPIDDAQDLSRAIKAVGRSSRDPQRVRQHVMKNARRLKLTAMIPPSWGSDGSLKRSRAELEAWAMVTRSRDLPPSRIAEFEADLMRMG